MTRREILKRTAIITGAAISAPFMGAFLSGCKSDTQDNDRESLIFSDEDISMISDIIDTIIPKTDSPSASEVGVHTTINHMVSNVYNSEERKSFKEKFDTLASALKERGFAKAGSEQKLSILIDIEGSDNSQLRTAALELKQQAVAYYLSTSEVATNFLNYLPVPGEYQSCITLEEVGGKAWAL